MIQLVKSSVVFNPENHTYFLGDKQLFGVTSTLIRRAFPNKYSGISEETLANAAAKGHELHEKIQNHDRFGGYLDDERIRNYDKVKESYGLTVLANEYTVSDEERYASQIDIVCLDYRNEVCLIDTKSTYNLDRASTALQLSIYKRFFEKQNPNLKVSHIYALWLPNKDHSICEFIELSPIDNNTLDSLIKADICDKEAIAKIFQENDIDRVVHFAAESHVDRSIKNPEVFVQTNVLGTAVMLNSAKAAWENEDGTFKEDKRFLHVSTDEVYGSLPDDPNAYFYETTPIDPHSPYIRPSCKGLC